MNSYEQDRETEKHRYDSRAAAALVDPSRSWGPNGSAGVPEEIRGPYLAYEARIREYAAPGRRVLDVCCGDGLHSLTAAFVGAQVAVADLAPRNVELALERAAHAGLILTGRAADAELLPWPDSSFDLITCAGSLSYVDLNRFRAELRRLLRPGGAFVFVDSLNHNPLYRFNRWVHFLRGNRSRSTLRRMPTLATLDQLREDFPDLRVTYHGIFSFTTPVLRLVGRARAARWLDRMDAAFLVLKRHAFKVVGSGCRPQA